MEIRAKKISQHFSVKEFERSRTADRLGIRNQMTTTCLQNARQLCEHVLEPVRTHFGVPIIISSGYRCPALNNAVGGAPSSQHMKGEAADFKIRAQNIKLYDIYLWMVDNLSFDQLIWEVRPNSKWIHVSYKNEKANRQQVFSCK